MSDPVVLDLKPETASQEQIGDVQMTITTKRNTYWKILNGIRYVIPYPRKVLNYVGVRISLLLRKPNHQFYPYKLGVEASSRCNLKCPLCPRTSDLNRSVGDMEFGRFKKMIDKMAPYLFQVRFHGLGEPTLNRRLAEMIEYAHKKGIFTNFHTNGHFLTEELINELISSGLDEINIALDGLTENIYGQYRVGGSAEKVKEGIIRFCRIKKERNSKSPRVNLQFLVMSHNEHEIGALRTFAASAGVDWVFLKTVNIMHGADSGNKSYLPSESKYSRYRTDKSDLELNTQYKCTRTFSELIVNWNGSISLCACDDPESGKIKGNIFEDEIDTILFGEDFVRARSQSLKMEYEMCKYCVDAKSPV